MLSSMVNEPELILLRRPLSPLCLRGPPRLPRRRVNTQTPHWHQPTSTLPSQARARGPITYGLHSTRGPQTHCHKEGGTGQAYST